VAGPAPDIGALPAASHAAGVTADAVPLSKRMLQRSLDLSEPLLAHLMNGTCQPPGEDSLGRLTCTNAYLPIETAVGIGTRSIRVVPVVGPRPGHYRKRRARSGIRRIVEDHLLGLGHHAIPCALRDARVIIPAIRQRRGRGEGQARPQDRHRQNVPHDDILLSSRIGANLTLLCFTPHITRKGANRFLPPPLHTRSLHRP